MTTAITSLIGIMSVVAMLAMLPVLQQVADDQCWLSDGWHGSGYYDCRLGPWQRENGVVVVPERRPEHQLRTNPPAGWPLNEKYK